MGTDKRREEAGNIARKNIPGPGAYLAKSYLCEGPKIGISSHPDKGKIRIAVQPGPGSYQPSFQSIISKSPAIGLGYGKRGGLESKATTTVPGPGAYAVSNNKQKGPKFGFGTSKRGPEKKPNQYPGPGNYKMQSLIGDLPSYEKSKKL